jgi:hypothetical protein
LSPHDPLRWAFYSYRALAHIFARQFDLAAEWAHKATRVPNAHYWPFAHRVSALGHLQNQDDLRIARTSCCSAIRISAAASRAGDSSTSGTAPSSIFTSRACDLPASKTDGLT